MDKSPVWVTKLQRKMAGAHWLGRQEEKLAMLSALRAEGHSQLCQNTRTSEGSKTAILESILITILLSQWVNISYAPGTVLKPEFESVILIVSTINDSQIQKQP